MHLQRLFRHTPNITFSFDGDRAGRDAAWKALETCLPSLQDGFQVSFLFLPDGEDPDTMVKQVGKDGFEELIKNATPLPDFLIDSLTQQADINRLDGRAKLSKLAKPLIEKFPNGVLKKLVLERLAVLTQVSAHDLLGIKPPVANDSNNWSGNKKYGNKKRFNNDGPAQQAPAARYITPVRRAVSLILQYPQHHSEFAVLATIADEQVRGIGMVHELRKACEENAEMSTAMLLERYRERSFQSTLAQLANHEHNNLDSLENDDAVALIRGSVAKIIEDYNAAEVAKAMNELELLTKRSVVTELSEQEAARKEALMAYIRASYQQ